MSEIKGIEKLKKFCNSPSKWLATPNYQVLEYVEEIEREIADKYMELPVDADGVPIHVGDKLEGWKHPIDEISFAATGIALDNCEGEHATLHMLETDLRHVKPDPVRERVKRFLRNVEEESCLSYGNSIEVSDSTIDEFIADMREAVSAE